MAKNEFTPADVAKEVKASVAPNPNQATVLSKPTDTTQAQAEQAAKDKEAKATQDAAVQQAQAALEHKKQAMRERVSKSSSERAADTVRVQLEVYQNSTPGSAQRVDALKTVVNTVLRYPKNSVLNTVLDFFKTNKDEAFLSASQALQGTAILEKSINLKVRVFYEIMMELAKGTATKQSIALNMIRNIFDSDDFVNWISVKMAQQARR